MGLFNYAHLPSWLEKNWLFRKAFLLRKLFLTRRRFSHYAQFAEDVSIVRHFPKKYKGFFVDVGCFHPVKYNNTYRLYKKGWRGVNIDIDSIKIEGFNMLRPGDVNIASAVSSQAGQFTYWSNGFYSLTITLDEAFAAGKAGYRKRTVSANTLTELLDGTKYSGQQVDFLSVDAEGHDYEVLRSLDFSRYAPRLIAVETHHPEFDQVKNDPLYQLLTEQGYVLANWAGLTLIFRRRGDEVLRKTTT